jgi:diguanylate cyclase (GGDEF)-like protein/PAS domain S-box-containing protein
MWEIAANDVTRFQQIVQQAATIVLCLDSAGVVTSVNGAFGRLLGRDPSMVIGSRLSDFAAPGQAGLLDDAMAVSAPGAAIAVEVSMVRARGAGFMPIRFEIVNLLDDPVVSGIVVTGQDVTDLQEVRRRLEHMANHDPLTGLPNRTLLGERLRELLRTGAALAVLFVDLDGFKTVNDTLGHDAGDELLRHAAQRLTREVATTDLVSRVGGDEFIVVAKGIDSRDDAAMMAERLQRTLRAPFNLTAGTACIDASVGMVVASPGHTVPSLLSEADLDMYAAKRSRSSEWRSWFSPAG